MKAALFTQYGPPDKLKIEEVEKPTPLDKQVLVKVFAASINASEWRGFEHPILARLIGGGLLKPKNTRLGTDLAGRVEAIGANVERFKPGDEVFGCAKGAFSEYVLARETNLVGKPANVTYEQAAAVPVAALTALQAIRYAGGIIAGQKVLVQGASGGVGMYMLQLTKFLEAEVTAVCSTRNLDLARANGADQVIDYTHADFTRNGQAYDLIFAINGYHSLSAYARALNPQGEYICVGGNLAQIFQSMLLGRWMSRRGGKKLSNMGIANINQEDLVQLAQLLEAGTLRPFIDQIYSLNQIADAFNYVLTKHPQGKVIIRIDDH